MTTQVNEFEDAARLACKPPSNEPIWKWCERTIRVTEGGMPGKFSTDLLPFVRQFFNAVQSKLVKRIVLMVAAQSAKTKNALNVLCWSIAEDPGLTMWVMAAANNTQEFKKKRMDEALENCSAIRDLVPQTRETNTRNLIMFKSMNLLLRGSNSRIGLQSDPVRRIFCDERREWKKGSIDLLRKRMRTFQNQLEVSMGTAGVEFDELHRDFDTGSQTLIHWNCEKCGHSQPFRFGHKASPLFPDAREKGGFIWDDNPDTRPGGKWDFDEVRKTVRYECESCGVQYKNQDKFRLLKSWHPVHRNPNALPRYVSIHWNAFYMPWSECNWGELVVEFLKATDAIKRGNIEPLKDFIQETLGEPWRDIQDDDDERQPLRERCGEYRIGDRWTKAPDLVEIVTVDVQNGYLVYDHRQVRVGGNSRMIRAGRMLDEGELRHYQQTEGIQDRCVWLDSQYRHNDVGRWCLQFGWIAMMGDDAKRFHRKARDPKTKQIVTVESFWKEGSYDPGAGTNQGGINQVKRFSWCKDHYREMLFLYRTQGKLQLWEIPSDIDDEYLKQMGNVIRVKHILESGAVEFVWKETGRHDFPDCECMQLAVADIAGLTTTS